MGSSQKKRRTSSNFWGANTSAKLILTKMTQDIERRMSAIEATQRDFQTEIRTALQKVIDELSHIAAAIATNASNLSHVVQPGEARICQVQDEKIKELNNRLDAQGAETRKILWYVAMIIGGIMAIGNLLPYIIDKLTGG